jgi:translation initiation factor RLI1
LFIPHCLAGFVHQLNLQIRADFVQFRLDEPTDQMSDRKKYANFRVDQGEGDANLLLLPAA